MKIITLSTAILIGAIAAPLAAQSASGSKPANPPDASTAQPAKPDAQQKPPAAHKGPVKDFDKFFKDGAAQAKDGAQCSKPARPIA